MEKRRIPLKHSSLSGYKNSLKSNKSVFYESSLEADLIELLEWDHRIKFYEEQPICIEYFDANNKRRTYTPDFFVSFHSIQNSDEPIHIPIIYEVKYSDELINKKDELEPKFKAARAYCRREGYDFKVICEHEIRTDHLQNIKFLKRYKKMEIHMPMMDYLREQLSKFDICTPEILIASCSQVEEKRAMLVSVLWVLVANGIIKTDLTKKLTMSSIIWIENKWQRK